MSRSIPTNAWSCWETGKPYSASEYAKILEVVTNYYVNSVIKYALGKYIYDRYPDAREGRISELRIALEQKTNLHAIADYLGFYPYLLIPRKRRMTRTEISCTKETSTLSSLPCLRVVSIEDAPLKRSKTTDLGRQSASLFEDAFEAFVGALSEDQGLVQAVKFVQVREKLGEVSGFRGKSTQN